MDGLGTLSPENIREVSARILHEGRDFGFWGVVWPYPERFRVVDGGRETPGSVLKWFGGVVEGVFRS